MFEQDRLSIIHDRDSIENILELTKCFIAQIDPLKIILFGSFADGTYTNESDFDFYIVVEDNCNICDTTDQAYKAIMYTKKRPVDIVVGTNTRFETIGHSKCSFMVEKEVQQHGILLYERSKTCTGFEQTMARDRKL